MTLTRFQQEVLWLLLVMFVAIPIIAYILDKDYRTVQMGLVLGFSFIIVRFNDAYLKN